MKTSPALKFMAAAWEGIPHSSWSRLNQGMHAALSTAIVSNMAFGIDDFSHFSKEFRSSYWIGETRSHEQLYALSCGSGHGTENPSAAQAYEKWRGRSPFLWQERNKTPARLCVGERFTWGKLLLTITSFSDDGKSLIGCTYGKNRETIERRVRVTLEEIKTHRKEFDDRRRAVIREFAASEDIKQLEEAGKRFQAKPRDSFRHFDIEDIRAAYENRKEDFAKAAENAAEEKRREEYLERERQLALTHDADLEHWKKGEKMDRYFNVVALRVKGEWVETSTMQRASVQGVRSALAFIKQHRRKGWKTNGTRREIDEHPIQAIGSEGVQVGCTLVPWPEVDRIAKALTKPPAA